MGEIFEGSVGHGWGKNIWFGALWGMYGTLSHI